MGTDLLVSRWKDVDILTDVLLTRPPSHLLTQGEREVACRSRVGEVEFSGLRTLQNHEVIRRLTGLVLGGECLVVRRIHVWGYSRDVLNTKVVLATPSNE